MKKSTKDDELAPVWQSILTILCIAFFAFVFVAIDRASENDHRMQEQDRILRRMKAVSNWPEAQRSEMMEHLEEDFREVTTEK